MAKMFALKTIIRQNADGIEEAVKPRQVFDARPPEARHLDALKSARPATEAEIQAHNDAQAKADGAFYAKA